MTPAATLWRARTPQAERRARTRNALLEAAARGLSRYGYSNLVLERVAAEAGYTRGALYHLFANKEDLAMAVVSWVAESWSAEVGHLLVDVPDPVEALVSTARAHAIFCRRDVARVAMTLRIEFSGQNHAVGKALKTSERRLRDAASRLIDAGRRSGRIPAGPPSKVLATAYFGAIEGLVINLAGQAPFDEELAERVVLGVLGMSRK